MYLAFLLSYQNTEVLLIVCVTGHFLRLGGNTEERYWLNALLLPPSPPQQQRRDPMTGPPSIASRGTSHVTPL